MSAGEGHWGRGEDVWMDAVCDGQYDSNMHTMLCLCICYAGGGGIIT